MRTCTRCGTRKPTADFYRDTRAKDGLRAACKPCIDADNAARYAVKQYRPKPAPPHKSREYHLRSKYGLEPDDYDRLLAQQNGVCAICEHPEKIRTSLSVDHDHETNEVRGLLCFNCNSSLGKLEAHMDNLLAYLDK